LLVKKTRENNEKEQIKSNTHLLPKKKEKIMKPKRKREVKIYKNKKKDKEKK
jgi:hypothetical protein